MSPQNLSNIGSGSRAQSDSARTEPVRFRTMYEALEIHTHRELDANVAFMPVSFPSFYSVAVSEYRLSFAFAVTLRCIRSVDPGSVLVVSANDADGGIRLCITATGTRCAEAHDALSACKALAGDGENGKPQMALDANGQSLSVSFPLPYWESGDLEVREMSEDEMLRAFRDAMALSL